MTKIELRKKLLNKRKNIPITLRKNKNIYITKECILYIRNFFKINKTNDCKNIGIYLSSNNEVETIEIIKWCWKNKIKTYVPRMNINSWILEWIEIKSLKFKYKLIFNIKQPLDNVRIEINKLNLIFVPIVGYDNDLNRIGYGKGYYDRNLKNLSCLKIGLAFLEQKVKKVPWKLNDIKLDYIITK